MLTAELHRWRAGFTLDVTLEAAAGRPLVLVGESGSGKTSTLRLLAGLECPDQGCVQLDGRVWFDPAHEVNLAPWERPVGYVPQDYALFPHLNVLENVAFGLRAQGLGRRAARTRAASLLERLGIAALAGRHPAALSGGERQRVAIARALVPEPKVLLLDEPLSALDLRTRDAVRSELRRLLAELPCVTVYVTHQPTEALLFGHRIAVLEDGGLTQTGTAEELLMYPRSTYVATFVGVNLFRGQARSAAAGGGIAEVVTPDGVIRVAGPLDPGPVFVAVSPREIILARERPEGTAQNVYRGRVRELVPEVPFGERFRVALSTHPPLVAEVTRTAVLALALTEGEEVYASFKATGVAGYPDR